MAPTSVAFADGKTKAGIFRYPDPRVLKLLVRGFENRFRTGNFGKRRDLRTDWTAKAFHHGSSRWELIWRGVAEC